jgi:hypothetical protein
MPWHKSPQNRWQVNFMKEQLTNEEIAIWANEKEFLQDVSS